MPTTPSSGSGGGDGDDDDTLICGFGPRRNRRDSACASVASVDTMHLTSMDTNTNNNTKFNNMNNNNSNNSNSDDKSILLGAGHRQASDADGNNGEGDKGGENGTNNNNELSRIVDGNYSSSLICGFGKYGDDATSCGSISHGNDNDDDDDDIGTNLNDLLELVNAEDDEAAPPKIPNGGKSKNNGIGSSVKNHHGAKNTNINNNNFNHSNDNSKGISHASMSISIPTKTDLDPSSSSEPSSSYSVKAISIPTKTADDDDRGHPTPTRNRVRRNSSVSVSSDGSGDTSGNMSMASEDAVVLMISMMEADADDDALDALDPKIAQELDPKIARKSILEKVCGRVFKRQGHRDYRSIPRDLEIDNGAMDQSWTSAKTSSGGNSKNNNNGSKNNSDKNTRDNRAVDKSWTSAASSINTNQNQNNPDSDGKQEPGIASGDVHVDLPTRNEKGRGAKRTSSDLPTRSVSNMSMMSVTSDLREPPRNEETETKASGGVLLSAKNNNSAALVITENGGNNNNNNNSSIINSNNNNNNNNSFAKGTNSIPPDTKPKVSFQSINTGIQPMSIDHARGRRSMIDPNLDVIREDDNDSSTVATDLKGSFVSQKSEGVSEGSDSMTSSKSGGGGGRSSNNSNNNKLNPIGEHAKSMARQLKMDKPLTSSLNSSTHSSHSNSSNSSSHRNNKVAQSNNNNKPSSSSSKSKPPKRALRMQKSQKRLQEMGRQAVVSRNSFTEYVRVVVPKADSVSKLIRDAIAANILFKACSSEELNELVEVFTPSEASAGSTIIRQGDEGDAFYVMERGAVDVYEGDAHKATLYSGASFGEMALLYGCPRSATLRTRYLCKLWSISRAAFRAITSQFKQRRMEAKVEFLKKVKIKNKFLSDVLSESELNTLALATLNETYEAGRAIIREGEPGDIFYMIDSGSVDVLIRAKGKEPVVTLTSGQFFGELALLSNDVRTASCVAKTDVECHILMRNDFNLLLGDLQSLMDGGDYRRRENEGGMVQPKKASKVSVKVELADLDILKVLGIGAFGRVRLAKLKRPVSGISSEDGNFFALKCISKQSLKENGLDSHILNEKAIMSGLEHPFINRFYCDMEDDEYLYFLLEALPGGELCKRLREEKQFPEAWGKFYSASVLFAFCHMHAKKIAYRDLKPENLVMDSVGYVKVVDFGLAKVIDGGKTWTLCGTPAYLAPEIVLNDGHDWAVDYWALGVFLFEMTSGREPFAAKNPMEVYKQIVSGHVEIPSWFSPTLTDLIIKLLNTSKSKRLGRTMGGGGAVMQHRWYADFDWDAHLEKKLEVPLQPKTEEILCEDSVHSDSRDSSAPSNNQRTSLQNNKDSSKPNKPPRLTYSLGQGNRHHQKLLEMMDTSSGENNDSGEQVDTVRMTMMRVIKQHERWSRTSRESSNSSTRNTSLGVGPKMSIRSSVNTESASIASSGFGENLDAFLRLQLMHLSLASKRSVVGSERSYQQFSLLSVCPTSITNEKNSELREGGYRFLDPFVTKKGDLVDQFPSGVSESDIDADALAAFCFPNGLRIRLVPRCAEEGAKRLGWLGENGDSYQLQGFTDVAGSLSHGCAITVREEFTHSEAAVVASILTVHRERRRSASVIARWWRRQGRRPERSQAGSNFDRSRHTTKRANSMVEKAGSMKWGRKGSDDERHSAVGLRGAMGKVMSMHNRNRSRKFKSSSLGDLTCDDSEPSDEESFGHESVGEEEEEEEEETYTPPSEHARHLGMASYQAMIDAEKEGDICIVERSYVLTGTKLEDQSLFFCALQNLIDMERKINDKAMRMTAFKRRSAPMGNENGSNNQPGEGIHYSFDPENRQAVLSALQSKLSLTTIQRRVSYPRNEMAHINIPHRRFVMDLSIMGFSKISLPLPLPEVSGQWGLATLFLRIKDSGLIILLKLLLLERSVLVVGETSEEVTACTTALLELLDPYKWASAFMPLLPRDMLDFVSSPVPFMAGMIVEGKQHLHSIIHDHGVKDAMLHGLSIVNLVSGKLIVTREQGTSDMLRRSFQTIPELSLYQKRLEEYCKSPSSNLRSFRSFFEHGASPKESLTLKKIKHVIKKHMSQFTMGLSDKPDAWQQYGEFNEATGTFDFCPDKFIQPLKDRMIFQIQFQEMMAHTQLFVGYVEELQLAHGKRSKLLSGPSAKFIARWVELHWHAKYCR